MSCHLNPAAVGCSCETIFDRWKCRVSHDVLVEVVWTSMKLDVFKCCWLARRNTKYCITYLQTTNEILLTVQIFTQSTSCIQICRHRIDYASWNWYRIFWQQSTVWCHVATFTNLGDYKWGFHWVSHCAVSHRSSHLLGSENLASDWHRTCTAVKQCP